MSERRHTIKANTEELILLYLTHANPDAKSIIHAACDAERQFNSEMKRAKPRPTGKGEEQR